eukprot:7670826-Karenia_brevis.AAC.1
MVSPDLDLIKCDICSWEFVREKGETPTCSCGAFHCLECSEKGRRCRCRGTAKAYKTKMCKSFMS